jgi:hypothetical protein
LQRRAPEQGAEGASCGCTWARMGTLLRWTFARSHSPHWHPTLGLLMAARAAICRPTKPRPPTRRPCQ